MVTQAAYGDTYPLATSIWRVIMGMAPLLPNVPDILTHMMNPVPKFNCAYAALDTSTAEEDEDGQEDAIDPNSCYSSAPADSLVQEVKKFIGSKRG